MKNINLFASASFFSNTCLLTGIILFLALGIGHAQYDNGYAPSFWQNAEHLRFVGDADNSGGPHGSFLFGFQSDANVDANPLFMIKRNGNIGINTNYPEQNLHVNGNSYFNGNVGISTSSPTAKLEVAGQVKITGGTPGAGKVLTSDANGLASWATPSSNIWSTDGPHAYYTTGNIGIGTTTPTNKLEITGGSLMLDTWNTPANGIFFRKGYDKNTGSPYNVSVTNIDWRNPSTGTGTLPDGLVLSGYSGVGIITGTNTYGQGGNVRLLVREDGNVGIGTTEPTKGKLHVKGSIHVENEAGDQTFHISAGKQLVFVGKDAWTQYQATLNVPNSPIQENNFSLWVSKGIVSEDYAIAKVNEWDDYVFDEAYELPTLEKIAAFVKANKHLPNIPSEAEVKQHGYSLHQLNRGFLKTIEELTLYTIEQEKKIESLEAKIAEYDQLAKEVQQLKAMMAELKE